MYYPELGCSILSTFFYVIFFIQLDLIKLKKLFMILRKNLFILILLLLNSFVDVISTEPNYHSSFIKELKKCFGVENKDNCEEMILLTERMQLREYYKGNIKCQTSLLGLQTELIRNIYFDGEKDNVSGKIIPSLIKNC